MASQGPNKIYRSIREKDKVGHRRRYHKKVYPYMAELWYPEAVKEELENSGGFYSTFPWRGIIHTTEGGTYAGAKGAYIRNRSAPHLTVSFERGRFQAWQHIPLNRAARALQNMSGGVETNRIRCIQIEVVGFAAKSGAFLREYLDGIGRLMRWIESNTTIQRNAPIFYGSDAGFTLARKDARQRMTATAWNNFNGWCGHQHVPENSHWDPGKIDIAYLLQVGAPVPPPPPPSGGIVAVNRPPIKLLYHASWPEAQPGKPGYIIITDDGGVFNFGGAPFFGSLGGVQLAKPIVDAQVTPSGQGYLLMGADGGIFAFGDADFVGRVEYNG